MGFPEASYRLGLFLLAAIALQNPARTQSAGSAKDAGPGMGPQSKGVITLAVAALDRKKNLVADLKLGDFTILEDGEPQLITSFKLEDLPVSICVLVDDSGSMRSKREDAAQMAMELLTASNPLDEFLVVKFNDEAHLDQDFTNELSRIQSGLRKGLARGGTSLYDSMLAASDHLVDGAKHPKKALVIISDGDDNESRAKSPAVLRDFQGLNRPVVYAIGLLKGEPTRSLGRVRHVLEDLSAETGGAAFFPRSLGDMHRTALRIAAEIRNQYSISYESSAPGGPDQYRKLTIAVRQKDLVIHARPGYFAEVASPSKKSRVR